MNIVIECEIHEYHCKFNNVTHVIFVEAKIDIQVIFNKESFKNLKSIIQGNWEIDDDAIYCIGVGWMKGKLVFNILCDKYVPSSLKGRFIKWCSDQLCFMG